jgi:hypothetical protein
MAMNGFSDETLARVRGKIKDLLEELAFLNCAIGAEIDELTEAREAGFEAWRNLAKLQNFLHRCIGRAEKNRLDNHPRRI